MYLITSDTNFNAYGAGFLGHPVYTHTHIYMTNVAYLFQLEEVKPEDLDGLHHLKQEEGHNLASRPVITCYRQWDGDDLINRRLPERIRTPAGRAGWDPPAL